jgi:hypothetical protein
MLGYTGLTRSLRSPVNSWWRDEMKLSLRCHGWSLFCVVGRSPVRRLSVLKTMNHLSFAELFVV